MKIKVVEENQLHICSLYVPLEIFSIKKFLTGWTVLSLLCQPLSLYDRTISGRKEECNNGPYSINQIESGEGLQNLSHGIDLVQS